MAVVSRAPVVPRGLAAAAPFPLPWGQGAPLRSCAGDCLWAAWRTDRRGAVCRQAAIGAALGATMAAAPVLRRPRRGGPGFRQPIQWKGLTAAFSRQDCRWLGHTAEARDDALANQAEALQVQKMRALLSGELTVLETRGHAFAHTTGDIFLLRVLRGHAHHLPQACAWYRECLRIRKERHLDELHLSMEEHGVDFKYGRMPHAGALAAYSTIVFDENLWRTPQGDLLLYDALGDFRTRELVKELGWEPCREFQEAMLERRLAVLDRMSREQGRLAKAVRIFDCEGTSIWSYDKGFCDLMHRDMDPISHGTQCEVVRANFIINTPWFGTKVYNLLKHRLPARMERVVHLLGSDFMENEQAIQMLGEANLRTLAKGQEEEVRPCSSTAPALRAVQAT
uniref:CRAL-TRIO domain-containing protein n=1 Tax=Pyrodinium bahamense TaxID=73915 RepID=A0A7S0AJZ7_9DINO